VLEYGCVGFDTNGISVLFRNSAALLPKYFGNILDEKYVKS